MILAEDIALESGIMDKYRISWMLLQTSPYEYHMLHELLLRESHFNVDRSLQVVEVIEPQRRDQRIDELLQKYHKSRKNRVIVFVLYKKEASRVEALLVKRGWKVGLKSCFFAAVLPSLPRSILIHGAVASPCLRCCHRLPGLILLVVLVILCNPEDCCSTFPNSR